MKYRYPAWNIPTCRSLLAHVVSLSITVTKGSQIVRPLLGNQVPSAVLDLLRTAYPISQGVVQELIDSVYNALWFVDPGFNVGFDYDTYFNVKNQSLKVSRTCVNVLLKETNYLFEMSLGKIDFFLPGKFELFKRGGKMGGG